MAPAPQSPAPLHPTAQIMAMGLYGAALALVGIGLFAFGVVQFEPLPGDTRIPWWVVAIAFVFAEQMVAHVQVGRQANSFSFSEVPLVAGLALASPFGLLAGRWVGGLVALVALRKQPAVKVGVNISVFTLEVGAALPVYRFVLGDASVAEPGGWAAAFAAAAVVGVMGNLAVLGAIAIWERSAVPFQLRRLGSPMIAAMTNTSLALLCLTIMSVNPQAFWLLLQVIIVLLLAYRAYATLHQKHETLESLHGFTQVAGTISETTTIPMLESMRSLLLSEVAEILLFATETDPAVRLRLDSDGRVTVTQDVQVACPLHREVADTKVPLVLPRGVQGQDQQLFLAAHGVRDALLAPLGAEATIGTLLVGSRYDSVRTFEKLDLQLFETIANHAGIALENGRLVDRLRREVLEKEHQASHDMLTGLANRTLFTRRVTEVIAGQPEQRLAVLMIDLDRFKEVNDTLGHHTGDLLLVEVGARLSATLDQSATIARFGGDEFAIMLPAVGTAAAATAIAQGLLDALRRPLELRGLTVGVGASIGIATYPDHGSGADVLVQRADVAMYAAKDHHRGVQMYAPEHDGHSHDRLALVADLRTALEAGKLEVHYQPKAELRTGRVIGAEALVRWQHHTRGWISPDDFVPIAEHSGLIAPLTLFVLERSLAEVQGWHRAGYAGMGVAVNLSASSLLNLEFPTDVERLLDRAGVPAQCLTLEITESTIMADPERSITVLRVLDSMGVKLAIDDFGTGYSSLSQLKRLPVTELKIDRSFVMNMVTAADDAVIVSSTVDLAHNLGLEVVAEGIEDAETWQRLVTLGCDVAQGYFLSRPLAPDALSQWIAQRRTPEGSLFARSE